MKVQIRVCTHKEGDSYTLTPDRHLLVVVHAVATVNAEEGAAGLSASPEKHKPFSHLLFATCTLQSYILAAAFVLLWQILLLLFFQLLHDLTQPLPGEYTDLFAIYSHSVLVKYWLLIHS